MTKVDLFHNLRVKFNELSLREHLIVEETIMELEQEETSKLIDVINGQDVKIADLEKQIEELKVEIEKLKYKEENYLQKIEHKEEVIKTLQNRIEKMKCCENCKHKKSEVDRCELLMYTMKVCLCKNKDKWELKE